ncbi:AraC family transcriptional regulator [Marinomonas sp. M1K-6]|uniref:AraC family transcriptional regulator n=1 Tax=Marinomonas profundi TaxID=2726122 RepID=A0A847R0U7_9GAMM|nr:AraC family transcriptional regulator [Marinomonas profundi]NLQ17172.1 AraC family transcriptional regulator [Marinomonas profundi]UDV04635.1 AraC family transcriptional regulator [Marinomonas profundi]
MFKDEFCYISTNDVLEGLEVIDAQFTDTTFGRHAHAEYVISVVDQGVKQFHHKGVTHNALAGDVSIISPDELHTGSKGNGEGWRYRAIYPSASQIRRIYQEVFAKEGLPTFKQSVIKDERLTRQMQMLLAKLGSGAESLDLEVHWELLLVKLLQKYAHQRGHSELILSKAQANIALARDYLADHFQQKVSLDEVAQQAGISKFHLIKEFKRCYQLTPHQYQIQQRLNYARAQLKAGASAIDVANCCGFHDQSHFSKTFVNAMGISPSAYRQQFFTR